MLLQLASGLEHIHEMKFVHRDLNPYNALIWVGPDDASGKVQALMKWAGFQLSERVDDRGTYQMSEIGGTWNWIAPELLKMVNSGKTEQGRGTTKSDVFSEGLTFGYILLEGKHPYGTEREEIAKNVNQNNPVNLQSMYCSRLGQIHAVNI